MRKTLLRTTSAAIRAVEVRLLDQSAVASLCALPLRQRLRAEDRNRQDGGQRHRRRSRRGRCPPKTTRRSSQQRDPDQDHRRLAAADAETNSSSCSTSTAPSTPRACRSARWRSWPDTTPPRRRKRCAGAIVGEGIGKAEVDLPGQAPIRDQLAADLLQRAAAGRQAEPDRPRLRDGPGAEDGAGPDHDRTDPPRPLRLPGRRSRCPRSPAASAPRPWPKRRSARPGSAAARRSATPTPTARAAGCRSTARSPSPTAASSPAP